MIDLGMIFGENSYIQCDMEIYINRVLFSDFYSNEIGVLEIMSDYDYGEVNSQYWKDLDSKIIK